MILLQLDSLDAASLILLLTYTMNSLFWGEYTDLNSWHGSSRQALSPLGFNTLGVSLPDHNDVEVSGLNLILDHVCHWNQKPCIINAQAGSSSTRYAQLHIVSVLQVVKDCVFHCDWSSYVHYMYAAASKWQLSVLTSLCARYVIPMKFARNSIFSLYWHFILKMAACITWHHMPCWDYDIIVYV